MNVLNYILKKKPEEAKCMGVFLQKVKENPKANQFIIPEDEAPSVESMSSFLDQMQNQGYIVWKQENGFQVDLLDEFFNAYAPVLNMLG